ncbi:uncharacterized protein L969DRAFT_494393 [Mixia osmundae IAM 14324]|uniref:DNA/pantothenate metabolism flavoprotein C-terminal domain-containing protein n=1 Tax=Mixia osmundae (strain CBS 9802 / IAM 14324 / JCM 22182 / KY 12970) TaxID=764103 RepID=G7E0Y2_MIXOS|nr:uncharacterized protein L969DRAFT_494393 [Mixia osmundae IAM 14324]KEI38874.1 hypothetical protein L969DRAFT_494393 [Mixia osmundae IAM 14324]GAA96492.1 hypothetical protein E5Q_03160 [Mixia osmundae IAM 14324]
MASTDYDAEAFFADSDPPPKLDEELRAAQSFIARHAREGRRIVLITSGGTTVPLEKNTVRFLDNFSAGTRGAASAEYFLRSGHYAVIFMHRQHSLQPFSRHYSHSVNPFLSLLELQNDDVATAKGRTELFPSLAAMRPTQETQHVSPQVERRDSTQGPQIRIKTADRACLITILRSYKLIQSLGLLHNISFTTVHDYLFLLRGVSRLMGSSEDENNRPLGRQGMYYLAAAVSDFFLPATEMSEHKIQSREGSLVIEMRPVPKVLKPLVEQWSNEGFTVSFKLETDPQLLIPKARAALQRYGHQLVIGNDLNRRKFEVVFVDQQDEDWLRISQQQTEAGEREIEEDIVDKLIARHTEYIAKSSS